MFKTVEINRAFSILLLFTTALTACVRDCPECFTPPFPLEFELLDKKDGMNLILNGSITSASLAITDLIENKSVPFEILENGNILITDVGWEDRNYQLSFQHDGSLLFEFSLNASRVSTECCEFTRYSDIFLGATELEALPGVIQVSIDLQ